MSTRTDRTLAIASFILALGLAVAGGFLVDSAFRDRYNAMVELYGHKKLAPVFLPPLRKDDGVRESGSEGRWFMSEAAMENMVVLSDMKRRGSAP